MMISDGAPVDDSTLSVNPGNYLERHLRWVIEEIETRSPVELIAIGIGHDVTRYYRRAVTIVDAEELGGAMTEKLAELFEEHAAVERPSPRRRRRRRLMKLTPPLARRRRPVRRADRWPARSRSPRRCAPAPRSRASRSKRRRSRPSTIATRRASRFGALEFRGGLVLTSNDRAFGGISSAAHGAGRRAFLAVTDQGSWLRGRIVYRDGKPVGIADAEMAPMLGPDGKPLAAQRLVRHRVARRARRACFMSASSGSSRSCASTSAATVLRRAASRSRCRPASRRFSYNKSLECLAAGAARLAARRHADRRHRAQPRCRRQSSLVSAQAATKSARFTVKRSDDFDVSDCTVLPPADLLLLERRFSVTGGLGMRIRRIPLAAIKPGALVDGPVLIDADLGSQIDNMEGIAVHRNAAGEIVLTLVSDDNFSPLQRNLLLQFVLVRE